MTPEQIDKLDKLWEQRVKIDMPLIERNVICNIAKSCAGSTTLASLGIYSGLVYSIGGGVLPSGWVASRTGVGDYNVNMYPINYPNFGDYSVTASADSSCYVNVQANSGTSFRLLALNANGTPVDANVCFHIIAKGTQ
jgi:hypothetical protein